MDETEHQQPVRNADTRREAFAADAARRGGPAQPLDKSGPDMQHVAATCCTRDGGEPDGREQPVPGQSKAWAPAEKGEVRTVGPRDAENVVSLFPRRPAPAGQPGAVIPAPANVLGPIGFGVRPLRDGASDGGPRLLPFPPPPPTHHDTDNAGTVAHAVVAHLAGAARDLPAHALTEQVIAATGHLVNDANRNRRRVVWTEAAAVACAYLRLMPPPAPWSLLGAEHVLGEGRADVVWEHPDLGVLVDELKSGRTVRRNGTTCGIRQARQYLAALVDEHGDRALGVRLFVAMSVDASLLLVPGQSEVPLFGSAFCPYEMNGTAR